MLEDLNLAHSLDESLHLPPYAPAMTKNHRGHGIKVEEVFFSHARPSASCSLRRIYQHDIYRQLVNYFPATLTMEDRALDLERGQPDTGLLTRLTP